MGIYPPWKNERRTNPKVIEVDGSNDFSGFQLGDF